MKMHGETNEIVYRVGEQRKDKDHMCNAERDRQYSRVPPNESPKYMYTRKAADAIYCTPPHMSSRRTRESRRTDDRESEASPIFHTCFTKRANYQRQTALTHARTSTIPKGATFLKEAKSPNHRRRRRREAVYACSRPNRAKAPD